MVDIGKNKITGISFERFPMLALFRKKSKTPVEYKGILIEHDILLFLENLIGKTNKKNI